MSENQNSSDAPLPDANDTIARLREAAERRAKQRRSRSRADASATAELEALQVRCSSLEAQLAAASESSDRAVREAEAKARELVDARTREREVYEAQLRERDEALEKAKSSLALRDAEVGKLSAAAKEVEELRYRVQTVDAEAEQLRNQLRTANANLESAKEDARLVEEAMSQLEQTQVQLNEVRARAEAEAETAARAEAARAELERVNAKMVVDLGEARNALASERDAHASLKSQSDAHIDKLGRELQDVVQAASAAEQALVESQRQAEEIMSEQIEKLDAAAARMADMEVQLGQVQHALAAATQENTGLLADKQRLQEQFEALRAAAEDQLAADEESLMREAELQAEIELLRASRDELQQALDALVSDREHTSDITVAQAELERSQRHVQELESELEHQRIELQQLQRDLEGARQAYEDAAEQADRMQAQLAANSRPAEPEAPAEPPAAEADQGAAHAALQASVAQYEAEMQMARQIIGNLEQQCEAYEGRISTLQREVRRLEGMVEEFQSGKHPHLRAVRQR